MTLHEKQNKHSYLIHCHAIDWIMNFRKSSHSKYCISQPAGWINIKMSYYQYRKSHCGDKTILRPSYLHNGISYTDKMTSLYWIRAQSSFPSPPIPIPPPRKQAIQTLQTCATDTFIEESIFHSGQFRYSTITPRDLWNDTWWESVRTTLIPDVILDLKKN